MSALRFAPADHRHLPIVRGYWCADDWEGESVDRPIATGPSTGGILTINVGRPNSRLGDAPGPQVSLAGLYTRVHHWRSCHETSFVMVMLTPYGISRLFPSVGSASVDRLVDLGALVGDQDARQLAGSINRGDVLHGRIKEIARWIDRRLVRVSPAADERLRFAIEALIAGNSVSGIATSLEISRRTLGNWVTACLGLSPKELSTLARIERSVRSIEVVPSL